MANLTSTTVKHVAHAWRAEAKSRRAISAVDPVADTLDYCATELDDRLDAIAMDLEYMNAEEYAAQPHIGVTPQTVRNWIKAGQLPEAKRGPKGWLIPQGATRTEN